MGYFWILDRLKSPSDSAPRQQRLIAHSSLPKSSAEYALDDQYPVKQSIYDLGVLGDESNSEADAKSAELAHIKLSISPSASTFDVDATLSSLIINYNPTSVRTIQKVAADIAAELGIAADSGGVELDNVLASSSSSRAAIPAPINASASSDKDSETFSISANLGSLEIVLNSVHDDLPLFLFRVTEAKLGMVTKSPSGGSSVSFPYP